MYTSPITGGTPQTVYTQSISAASEKSVDIQEKETAAQPTDQDTYTPSGDEESVGTYKMDIGTVNQMKEELEQAKLRFLHTVEKSLGIQISYGQGTWKDISPEDQAAAQEAISENGYWGVKQTSQRIVAFGKALVGGDPSRVEEMRDAFIKGYEAATKGWGSALPEISRKTYDAVMKLFDEWAGISSDMEAKENGETAEDPDLQPGASEETIESEAAEEESADQSGESGGKN